MKAARKRKKKEKRKKWRKLVVEVRKKLDFQNECLGIVKSEMAKNKSNQGTFSLPAIERRERRDRRVFDGDVIKKGISESECLGIVRGYLDGKTT